MRLNTDIAEDLCEKLDKLVFDFLHEVDTSRGVKDSRVINAAREIVREARLKNENGPDTLFDDFFVLDEYLTFFSRYGQVWKLVTHKKFGESWRKLQDALDSLRIVCKFSRIDISKFENQLLALEKAYPYRVFFSIGMVVDWFECSICSKDIDSYECPHRLGNLYRGKMAHGIARNAIKLDHVSIVERPQDRRCVLSYDDNSEDFKLVHFIAQLLYTGKMRVSNFEGLKYSKRLIPNPEHKRVGRNDPCYCASGRKFKRCCMSKSYLEGDHVDIVANQS